jgi:hypothetical protein
MAGLIESSVKIYVCECWLQTVEIVKTLDADVDPLAPHRPGPRYGRIVATQVSTRSTGTLNEMLTFLRRQSAQACCTCLRFTGSPPLVGSEATNFTLRPGVAIRDGW